MLTQTVNRAASSIGAVGSSVNPSVFSQSTTLSATVSSAGGTPTGNVEFFDGATSLGVAALSGATASLPVSSLAVGSRSLTAVFQGDSNFEASPASAPATTQVVNKAASGISLAVSPRVVNPGQTITLTASVSPVSPATATPGGAVDFAQRGVAHAAASRSSGVRRNA